ncbi:hypothetical protein BC939DRAFT_187904 [Gamsiella multidivaricata]|uniref:uncharacterized protein n=1 Tax=Gamsiella multidivaricata TaxID=101098 RepID=UPI00221E4D36|nr:uncharacterized protein BC939DRAFT_187904 [Gamsiella multidivaricata]KAI7831500.1 hypothetical protein BC939DRAFT_187904 [Gamsiella multidivaricata]
MPLTISFFLLLAFIPSSTICSRTRHMNKNNGNSNLSYPTIYPRSFPFFPSSPPVPLPRLCLALFMFTSSCIIPTLSILLAPLYPSHSTQHAVVSSVFLFFSFSFFLSFFFFWWQKYQVRPTQ